MRRVVIFTGSRDGFDKDSIRRVMEEYDRAMTLIVHGDAPGVDTIVDRMADALGYTRMRCPANWKLYHDIGNSKSAGPARNRLMLATATALVGVGAYDSVEVCAFHPNIDESRGTKHMVGIARRAGQLVRVFSE